MNEHTWKDVIHAVSIAATLFAVLIMHGCSTANSDQPNILQQADSRLQNFLDKIQTITVTDAQAALEDVHAHGDIDLAALQCYPEVINFVQSSPLKPSTPNVKGVLSVNQIKRDLIIGGVDRSGPFQVAFRKLHVACAAYAGDEARFAAEFAAMIGAAGASGGATMPFMIGPAVPLGALK